jgi:hypothetical protein
LKKKIPLGIAMAIILSVGGYFLYSRPTQALEKCPDAYGTDDAGSVEYLAATNKWTNNFFDAHPDATMSDWAQARYQFWVDNHCTAALEGYEQAKAGKADPEMMKRVDGIIRDVITNPTP